VIAIEAAKRPETRERRIAEALSSLLEGSLQSNRLRRR
jgi:hypothetical protein